MLKDIYCMGVMNKLIAQINVSVEICEPGLAGIFPWPGLLLVLGAKSIRRDPKGVQSQTQ